MMILSKLYKLLSLLLFGKSYEVIFSNVGQSNFGKMSPYFGTAVDIIDIFFKLFCLFSSQNFRLSGTFPRRRHVTFANKVFMMLWRASAALWSGQSRFFDARISNDMIPTAQQRSPPENGYRNIISRWFRACSR